MTDVDYKWIAGNEPVMRELVEFRYRILYEPFGVAASFDWNDGAVGVFHLAAFERGDIAGYGRLEVRGPEAQVRHLSVDLSKRGRGIGAGLLDLLVLRAKQQACELVYLNARFTALGLYRSRGFEERGPIFHTEHTHLPHKRMELRV